MRYAMKFRTAQSFELKLSFTHCESDWSYYTVFADRCDMGSIAINRKRSKVGAVPGEKHNFVPDFVAQAVIDFLSEEYGRLFSPQGRK